VTTYGVPASFEVTPEDGGMVSVPVGESGTATLVVPPGAVDSFEVFAIVPISADNGDEGIALEPAGVWLSEPALLRFEGVPGDPLARIDGMRSWYTAATAADDGSIRVVRLRPFLQSGHPEAAVDLDLTAPWEELVTPRLAMVDGSDVNPFDLAAAKQEHDAARRMSGPATVDPTNPSTSVTVVGGGGDDSETPASSVEPGDEGNEGNDGDESREQEVRNGAGDRLGGGGSGGTNGSCAGSAKGTANTVETARTAGGSAPGELPDCIELGLRVTAILEMQMDGRTIKESVSTPSTITTIDKDCGGFICQKPTGQEKLPTGLGSLEGSTTVLPLEGSLYGINSLQSLAVTGMAWGLGKLAGVELPMPDENSCTISKLSGGSMAVTITIAPERQLLVELTPTPGSYAGNCIYSGAVDTPSIIWDTIGPLLGRAGSEPYRFMVPAKRNTARLNSLVQDWTAALSTPDSNGKVSYSDSQVTLSAVIEVMVDYQPKGG
jgi:hypothetical protein